MNFRITAFLPFFLAAASAFAQSPPGDMDKYFQVAEAHEGKVFSDRIKPEWAGNLVWYKVQTTAARYEYWKVDTTSGVKQPLFDSARLAAALQVADAGTLNLENLKLADDGKLLKFRHADKAWQYPLPDGPLASGDLPPAEVKSSSTQLRLSPTRRTGPPGKITFSNATDGPVEVFWLDTEGGRKSYLKLTPGQESGLGSFVGHRWLAVNAAGDPLGVFEVGEEPLRAVIDAPGQERKRRDDRAPQQGLSPDGKWRVGVGSHNLFRVAVGGDQEEPLTTDGTAERPYTDRVEWAPDSKTFVGTRFTRVVQERKVTLVESSPPDQVQPRVKVLDYAKPGDDMSRMVPVIGRIADRDVIPVDESLFPNAFGEGLDFHWLPGGKEVAFSYNQRGHQVYRILGLNVSDGKVRTIVEEKSDTFIDWNEKTWRHWLDGTGELLWMSERDGWCHLYLYDVATGAVKNQVTRGEWVVRNVESVDEAKRQVWFLASGLVAGQDPYYLHLCRVNFDGSGFVRLTEGDGTHQITFSPDRSTFVDQWSRVDQPPVTELRRSEDGKLLAELGRADHSALLAAGWTPGERFSAPGRDGVTMIHGVIVWPAALDPARHYPVVEEVYAGPQGAFAPKAFGLLRRAQQFSAAGFVWVMSDGMGTNFRGKKFHNVAWKNLGDAGFLDRIAWMKAAAATRPWMDLSRVGIFGGSAGGQNAMRALLDHGDFYKAAVADCGCHDNRMDKIWWNEQWLGYPLDDSYVRGSNVVDAHKLRGQLLLTVGEMDSNVDPASTMQVVNALVKAGKFFELLVFPGANHGAGESPYGQRRRMEFFVRHLRQGA